MYLEYRCDAHLNVIVTFERILVVKFALLYMNGVEFLLILQHSKDFDYALGCRRSRRMVQTCSVGSFCFGRNLEMFLT